MSPWAPGTDPRRSASLGQVGNGGIARQIQPPTPGQRVTGGARKQVAALGASWVLRTSATLPSYWGLQKTATV